MYGSHVRQYHVERGISQPKGGLWESNSATL